MAIRIAEHFYLLNASKYSFFFFGPSKFRFARTRWFQVIKELFDNVVKVRYANQFKLIPNARGYFWCCARPKRILLHLLPLSYSICGILLAKDSGDSGDCFVCE